MHSISCGSIVAQMQMGSLRRLRPFIAYTATRLVTLAAVVAVAVTVTVVTANMGGLVDDIVRADIAFRLGMMLRSDERARGLRNYRAIFLQAKQASYIEASLAYGAGNARIVGHYLVPRVVPILIPQIVVLIPGYVFLESALSFLGMSDPHLPTWGKLLQIAFGPDGLSGPYHVILVPAIVLLALGLAPPAVGYGLERVLNPRLEPTRW